MKYFVWHVVRRAFLNIKGNLYPNLSTVGIIAISMLVFSSFTLIAFNLGSFIKIWEEKIEVMAYLKRGTPIQEVESLLEKTRGIEGVESVRYISSSDALAFMESKLGGQKNLLEGIHPGILPSSFEIELKKEYRNSARIKEVISALKKFPQFEEIQFGQEWVDTFSAFVHILNLTKWILGGLLLIAMIFIISNTLQLTISARREEIEIMRIVGASPSFIHVPIYLEGLLQGLFGAGLAVFFLYVLQEIMLLHLPSSIQIWTEKIPIHFLPSEIVLQILFGGMLLGLFGSFIASMRFLRYGE
ncbi:MAG: cell division protein FtsX [Thermodesulfobacteriota bacterium]